MAATMAFVLGMIVGGVISMISFTQLLKKQTKKLTKKDD